jgi:light-independent protochlorophyllide reductase subunit B
MKLAYWMYAGPAHIGTLRVASSFKNVHAIMHAPLGDDYFNVMRSMLERERDFTPVTASIVDRHVLARGSQEKVVETITRKDREEKPDLIVLTPTCTSSILQEDLQSFVERATMESKSDVVLADVNHYRVNELQAADRTLEQIIRFYIEKGKKEGKLNTTKTKKPSANLLGMFTLGFHHQHDSRELKRLLNDLGVEVNQVVPEGGSVTKLKELPKAWFNVVPYREIGLMAANYLEKDLGIPFVSTTPMGVIDTASFIREVSAVVNRCKKEMSDQINGGSAKMDFCNTIARSANGPSDNCGKAANDSEATVSLAGRARSVNGPTDNKHVETDSLQEDAKYASQTNQLGLQDISNEEYIDQQTRFVSQAAWFSRSIDCQNLTGKKAVVFGDATHAASMTKILAREMGIRVSCSGTYCKHDSDWFREQVQGFCDQVLITDDHTQVGDMIARIEPAAIFGTQMERHIGKRLDIPCGVISAPVHIQNFPLGYRPFLGYEGTNQVADLVYNSFTLGMEDHLLEIFGGHDTKQVITKSLSTDSNLTWTDDGLGELNRIPGFVRGKIKRNTEKYARENNISQISMEVMYAAKEAAGA